MRCPTDDDLFGEYLRRRTGEPLLFAAHLATCETCQARLERLRVVDDACRQYHETVSEPCLTPAELAGLAEGRLRRKEREHALAHIAVCISCREMTGELALLQREAKPVAPRSYSQGWRQWLFPAFSACAGAAIMFIAMSISPARQPTDTRVTPIEIRGAASSNDAAAALRAVNPLSEEDRHFARDIWQSALAEANNTLRDNPADQATRHWREVLHQGIDELTRREDTPATKEGQ